MATGSDEDPDRGAGRAFSSQDLLALAVALVNSGVLPREDSARVFAGPGQDRLCALCKDNIDVADVEYEFSGNAGHAVSFHIPCYRAWQQASASVDSSGDNG